MRTRYSLAQLLEQQEHALVIQLISKHGGRITLARGTEVYDLFNAVRDLDDQQVMAVVAEVVGTAGDMRHRITPRHRFDERMRDLTQCLAMDGYMVDGRQLRQADPSIADAAPIDDDLIRALNGSTLPRRAEIITKIEASATAFRSPTPDYNAALVNARVALETLAADVALELAAGASPLPFNPAKWGEVIQYLRTTGEITSEEERGLAGVFQLLSAGRTGRSRPGFPKLR